ncbi:MULTISPECIES: daptide-type RiPP [Streptomyces]|uniref:daptide-type RiPP n=1 Tax=Streptomyces TaxID=1883 RepID=UPI0019176914|nr:MULTISPECIES: daptide-type RiPP [Streptomyces]
MQDELKNDMTALELDMQELEAMEAPGFWSNFKDGTMASIAVSAVYGGVASAIAT